MGTSPPTPSGWSPHPSPCPMGLDWMEPSGFQWGEQDTEQPDRSTIHELLHDGVVECVGSDQVPDVSDELGYRLMVEIVDCQPRRLHQSKFQHPLQLCLLLVHSASNGAVGECSESMSGSSLPSRYGWCGGRR